MLLTCTLLANSISPLLVNKNKNLHWIAQEDTTLKPYHCFVVIIIIIIIIIIIFVYDQLKIDFIDTEVHKGVKLNLIFSFHSNKHK